MNPRRLRSYNLGLKSVSWRVGSSQVKVAHARPVLATVGMDWNTGVDLPFGIYRGDKTPEASPLLLGKLVGVDPDSAKPPAAARPE